MGGRDRAGVFPCFVFVLCNAGFCFPPINDSIGWWFSALSLLTSPVLFSSTALRCFALHFRNSGPSRRRVEQANLYGLRFAVSPEPNCEPRPHICETYQSIGRIEEAREQLGAAALGCLGFSK